MLDNAAIHRAGAIQDALALLKKQGVKSEILSSYNSEFNRVEVTWRLLEQCRLGAKRRTSEGLMRAIEHVFEHLESQFNIRH